MKANKQPPNVSRVSLWDGFVAGQEILKAINQLPEAEKAALAGSLRRGTPTIGDIDIVIQASKAATQQLLDKLQHLEQVASVIDSGRTWITMVLRNQIKVDICIVEQQQYGAAMLYFTGPVAHNSALQSCARQKGWKLNECGLFDLRTDSYLPAGTEEDIYHQLGLQYIAPELRETINSITLTSSYQSPSLISFSQIKGDMRIESKWGKGEATIPHIAHYALNAFPHYEYIIIADQLPDNTPDQYLRQWDEIDEVNRQLKNNFIKKGIETAIDNHGSLSVKNELLLSFDWVVATIQEETTEDNTEKLIKACECPYVHCIGHTSSQIYNAGSPPRINWDQLFKKAAATHTAIEINAQPNCLELDDALVYNAVQQGVHLVINTAATALSQFDLMQLGVWIARRGGGTKQNILNSRSWQEIEQFKLNKRLVCQQTPAS